MKRKRFGQDGEVSIDRASPTTGGSGWVTLTPRPVARESSGPMPATFRLTSETRPWLGLDSGRGPSLGSEVPGR
jgi:hypothetical protein